jgi:hypothetical protein
MSLAVIGAGVGRTGTVSLKMALERLLGAPCYHMLEVFEHPEHVAMWQSAVRGDLPSWDVLFEGYAATTDWPSAAFWQPLSAAYPDALVVLSVRRDASEWYESASATINELVTRPAQPGLEAWRKMVKDMYRTTFTPVPFERGAALSAYERHNATVRSMIPSDRLLEWQVTDGWEPLCERLRLPVPSEQFPHANRRDEFGAFLESVPRRRSLRARFRRVVRGHNVRQRIRDRARRHAGREEPPNH